MSTILSIASIINVGRASTYLSANYTSKGSLFGGRVIKPTPPIQIAMVTDGLEWGNTGGAETSASLRLTANYLYWLCGRFQLEAQDVLDDAGGGSISPSPNTGALPYPIDWIVSGTASSTAPLANGETTVTLNGSGGMPDLRNYNIDYTRGGQPQYTTNPGDGSTYYSWYRTTGVFTISTAAYTGEPMRITPIG